MVLRGYADALKPRTILGARGEAISRDDAPNKRHDEIARANSTAATKKILGMPITMGDPLLRICSVMFAMFTELGPHPAADALDPTRNQMVDVVYNINAWWDFKKEPTFERLILELNDAARQQIRLLSDDELAELTADNIRLTQGYSENRETTSGAVLVNVDIKNEAGDTMPELNVAFNDQKDVENLLANFIGRLIASSPEKTTQDLDRILAFSEAEYEKKQTPQEKMDYLMYIVSRDTVLKIGTKNEEHAVQANTCILSLSDMAGQLMFGAMNPQLWRPFLTDNFAPYSNRLGANAFAANNNIGEIITAQMETFQRKTEDGIIYEMISLIAPEITIPKDAYRANGGVIDFTHDGVVVRKATYVFADTYLKTFP